MTRQGSHHGPMHLGRPSPVVGAPLVLLAMVLLATAGGLSSASVVRPVTQTSTFAVLALPGHGVAGIGVGLDDRLPGEVVLVQRAEPGVLRSEMLRLGPERLNLPPPRA